MLRRANTILKVAYFIIAPVLIVILLRMFDYGSYYASSSQWRELSKATANELLLCRVKLNKAEFRILNIENKEGQK